MCIWGKGPKLQGPSGLEHYDWCSKGLLTHPFRGVLVNDPDYRASLTDFKSFIEKLSERIIEIDETVPELPLKDLVSGLATLTSLSSAPLRQTNLIIPQVFKIYRDVRFSKDQTPYKVNVTP
jgi:hypothetical protein